MTRSSQLAVTTPSDLESDGMLQSGMEEGAAESMDRLEALLKELAS